MQMLARDPRFGTNKGAAVRSVQEMLRFLGYRYRRVAPGGAASWESLTADGDYGAKTEAVVVSFQRAHGLLQDGIVGPQTMAALEKEYNARLVELHTVGVDSVSGLPEVIGFATAPADVFGEGYDKLQLRADVVDAYMKVYKDVHAAGGLLTSSGGRRWLSTNLTASRSPTSMHYLGRALDLFLYSGMVDPQADPYVVVREASRRYRVYARCAPARASEGALPPAVTVQRVVSYEDRIEGIEVTDHLFDLTACFKAHGFEPISARPSFEGGGSMMGAEWWHFQYEAGLVPGVSTFGAELCKVYSKQTLTGTPPWQYRDNVWHINWF